MPRHAMACQGMPCHALLCLGMPWHAIPLRPGGVLPCRFFFVSQTNYLFTNIASGWCMPCGFLFLPQKNILLTCLWRPEADWYRGVWGAEPPRECASGHCSRVGTCLEDVIRFAAQMHFVTFVLNLLAVFVELLVTIF